MARNERSGNAVGTIASKGLKNPGMLSNKEIKALSASVLTQRPDRRK